MVTDAEVTLTRTGFSARFRSLRGLPLGSLFVLAVLGAVAVFAPLIAPHDPLETNLSVRLQPPVFQGGTWAYPLGTDYTGRDILSRTIFGARVSLGIGSAALLLGGAIGTSFGLVAGYAHGHLDAFLMRVTDLGISYPVILLALVFAAAFGPRVTTLIVLIAFTVWSRTTRVVRDHVLLVREMPYVDSARVAGAPSHRIVIRHVLPNVVSTILVLLSLQFGQVIVIEASLSFLGAGVPPPDPSWGSMIALGRDYLINAWWVPAVPGLAMMVTVLTLNLSGDWLRDRFDPRIQRPPALNVGSRSMTTTRAWRRTLETPKSERL